MVLVVLLLLSLGWPSPVDAASTLRRRSIRPAARMPPVRQREPYSPSVTRVGRVDSINTDPQYTDLMDFYYVTQFEQWLNDTNWGMTNTSVCQWFGITCYGELLNDGVTNLIDDGDSPIDPNTIVSIDLTSNNIISGELPQPLFPSLTHLRILKLGNNFIDSSFPHLEHLLETKTLQILDVGGNQHLSGALPEWFFNFTQLQMTVLMDTELLIYAEGFKNLQQLKHLELQYTYVIGTLNDFSSLINLEYLNLAGSGLATSTMIPFSNFTHLTFLSLQMVPVSGPWPNLEHLESLKILDLSYTKMFGRLGSLPPELDAFICLACAITENIQSIYDTLSLQELHLGYVQSSLNVHIEQFVANLRQLSIVTLDGIHVIGNILEFNAMSNLTVLSLIGCQMDSQTLPSFNLPFLQVLDLSENTFFGKIPNFQGCSSLETLILRENQFDGTFPQLESWCTTLKHIDFGSNDLFGTIPSFDGLCQTTTSSLTHLILDDCVFTGTLTDTFHEVGLIELNLGGNFLSGKIPTFEGPSLETLEGLYLFNNDFRGDIPMRYLSMNNLRVLDLNRNHLEGSLDFSQAYLPKLVELRVSENLLTCPIVLPKMAQLVHLAVPQNLFNADIDTNNNIDDDGHQQISKSSSSFDPIQRRFDEHRQRRPHHANEIKRIMFDMVQQNASIPSCTLDFLTDATLETLISFDGKGAHTPELTKTTAPSRVRFVDITV